MMHYNRVGKTAIWVSAVGFGTSQLRLVPEQQALDTLKRGFALGVNWVHTAPDYEGADDLVARAIAASGHDVMAFSQGYGDMAHFEYLFDSTCDKFKKTSLEMFGIAGIEDREALGENVWGAGGMLDFLVHKKRAGRLGGIFCTTHGAPDYVARLITSGYFDAVMLAYNPLGFHLLSLNPGESRLWENLPQIRVQIFPLAAQHQVGLLIMKPLAGGLLCEGKAFPPHKRFSNESVQLTATDILRHILRHPEVCGVVPGTASVAEAEENARAGHAPIALVPERVEAIERATHEMRTSLCSRCGLCDSLCSQSLPVSWLFRDAYISNYPSETFETPDQLQYFHLHPDETAACRTCRDVTCHCPYSIDIPGNLMRIHQQMLWLREQELLPATPSQLQHTMVYGAFPAQVVSSQIPASLQRDQVGVCRLYVHNVAKQTWTTSGVVLAVVESGKLRQQVQLRHDVEPGTRTHFTFTFKTSKSAGDYLLQFLLMSPSTGAISDDATELLTAILSVTDAPLIPFLPRLYTLYRKAREVLLRQIRLLFTTAHSGSAGMRWPFFKPSRRHLKSSPPVHTYGVYYHSHNIPECLPAKTVWGAWICLENRGNSAWQRQHPEGKRVDLVVTCDREIWATHHMPRDEVHPGERVTIHFPLRVPEGVGAHALCLDLVEQGVTAFADQGVEPLTLPLLVEPVPCSRSATLYEQAARISPWYYQPTQGIGHSVDGRPFPLFISKAKGCYIWDLEGRQYIDYIMGWGCALLGYAEARIQQAVREVLDSAAVLPFPHPLEIEVAQMLTEDIPCAEMVVFGKNGSDVCTVAARLARVYTGKKTILCCGYHGWQDFWVEQAGFAATGVPDRPVRLIHHFNFNNLSDFMQLYRQYRDDLAAVMLEPSGPAESVQGPVQDANSDFLAAIAQAAREAGALLIYDEIMTGYRYPSGSVQRATGIIPDLTCLGKALSAGMPLAALVGRAAILQQSMEHTHYGPTFRGEVYSLAAAKAALQIYRAEPVAEYVWDYGTRLKQGIHGLCNQLGIAAACLGPPFRMALVFNEPDPERLRLKRTLYQQELLKAGVITYNGVMLPSYAHSNDVLEATLVALRLALGKVAMAEREENFHRYLEIPLV